MCNCAHDEHDHAAIVRNLVWDKLTPADRASIIRVAETIAEARQELEGL